MIKIENFSKTYDEKVVYDNFNLQIEKGKITAILGESGSGKTTLLSAIANVTDFNGDIIGMDCPVSVVFQEDRLINNLTVKENVEFICGKDCSALHYLEKVGLKGAENLYPKSLSAGMKRRVAIVRAMLFKANTLLMDEPFINLDLALKYLLISEIKKKQKESGQTVIMVTHDIKEAVEIADRILVLKDGKIIYDQKNVHPDCEREIFQLLIDNSSLTL